MHSADTTLSRGVEPFHVRAQSVPKLATLPPELYNEIISYWGVLPVCVNYRIRGFTTLSSPENGYQERNKALRALCAASRAIRAVFHPRLWERLDCVFVPEGRSVHWYEYCVTSTTKKLRGLLEEPNIRAHVRVFAFTITETVDTPGLIVELGRVFPTLTSLHTIQLLWCKKPDHLTRILNGCNLDNVHTVSIDPGCAAVARLCRNAQKLFFTQGSSLRGMNALESMQEVTHVGGFFDYGKGRAAKVLVKYAPRLVSLEVRGTGYAIIGVLNCIRTLQFLRKLELALPHPYEWTGSTSQEEESAKDKQSVLEATSKAKELMQSQRAVPAGVDRVLIVRHLTHLGSVVSHRMYTYQ